MRRLPVRDVDQLLLGQLGHHRDAPQVQPTLPPRRPRREQHGSTEPRDQPAAEPPQDHLDWPALVARRDREPDRAQKEQHQQLTRRAPLVIGTMGG
ncbi:hypothetical protein [Kitasatospora sp. NPDC002965]|uniref:hypothetical protein n=1 Tax=Kitasatospora sp. NPDC002965 TaxID=3154775 RepID=UPI0033A2068A